MKSITSITIDTQVLAAAKAKHKNLSGYIEGFLRASVEEASNEPVALQIDKLKEALELKTIEASTAIQESEQLKSEVKKYTYTHDRINNVWRIYKDDKVIFWCRDWSEFQLQWKRLGMALTVDGSG